jgi:hypothetical protein
MMSTTSAHVRKESAAHRRKPSSFAVEVSSPDPTPIHSSSASPANRSSRSKKSIPTPSSNSSLSAAELKYEARQTELRRQRIIKYFAGFLIVACLLYSGNGALESRRIKSAIIQRKQQLRGRGEAFVSRLPRNDELLPCTRVMVFKFGS